MPMGEPRPTDNSLFFFFLDWIAVIGANQWWQAERGHLTKLSGSSWLLCVAYLSQVQGKTLFEMKVWGLQVWIWVPGGTCSSIQVLVFQDKELNQEHMKRIKTETDWNPFYIMTYFQTEQIRESFIISSYTEPRTLVQLLHLHLGVEFIFYDLTWLDLRNSDFCELLWGRTRACRGQRERENPSRIFQCPLV